MALFKHMRGKRADLNMQPLHDGYAYFCTDDGSFHVDYVDSDGNLQRKQINAQEAERLGLYTADDFLLKAEMLQPDWNQTDETEMDYIKNKPDLVGQKDEATGAEIFNDYTNLSAIGDYSSVHGKSTTNFNDITIPETIYYKAFPNTIGYDGTLLKEISYYITPPYNFDYIYLKLEEIYNPEITSKKIAIDIYYYAENGEYEIEYYDLDANGELRIPASELLDSFKHWDSGEDLPVTSVDICPCVDTQNDVNLKAYAVTERGDIYDFESLQFTTDSTDALGEVNKVYSYVDSWGNTRYTLWQDYHPELTQALPDEEPVKEVPANDPIYAVILYEALVNGGESFSLADGEASTVFGKDNITKGYGAIASGRNSIASSNCSVAIGKDTVSRGPCSFSVGLGGKATGMYSFAANEKGVASGYASMVVGDHCASTNYYSISGGYQSRSSGHSAIAIGYMCEASGMGSVAMGSEVKSRGAGSVSFGKANEVLGDSSVAIGYGNKANGTHSIALGLYNVMDGIGAGIGESNIITVNGYALGKNNKVYGYNSVAAVGAANTVAETAFNGATAIGHNNTITGEGSCAVGVQCKSKALGSVALGWQSEASGRASIAAGISAVASGADSVAIGRLTKATGNYQVVLGRGNVPLSSVGSSSDAVLIVGIGVRDNERANGLVVYGDGRVEVGADPVNGMDAATKGYVDALNSSKAGHKGTATGSEIFNDYNNNTVLGEYASVHGKSSTNYTSITIPEKLYYKALSGAKVYDGTILTDVGHRVNAPFNFDYLLLTSEIYKNASGPFDIVYNDPLSANHITISPYFDANGECKINLTEKAQEFGFEIEFVYIDFLGQSGIDCVMYAVTEGRDTYDFESLEFTINPTGTLGTVDNVYQYKDNWGNICYTLWSNHHPNKADTSDVSKVPPDSSIIKALKYEALINGGKQFSLADGRASAVFGVDSVANGYGAFATGVQSIALFDQTLASGMMNKVRGQGGTSFGYNNIVNGRWAFAANEGGHALGYGTAVFGDHCTALGFYDIVGGKDSIAKGNCSFVYGNACEGNGDFTVSMGFETKANGSMSLALGRNTEANGEYSVALTEKSKAEGKHSLASGYMAIASKVGAIALGNKAEARGEHSVAIGASAIAEGTQGVAIGRNTIASGYQTVIGRDNTMVKTAVLVVGNGNSATDRSNALVAYKDGRVEVGADPQNAMDVVTKQYLDSKLGDINTTLLNIIAQQEAIIAKQNELLGGNA